MLVYPGQKVSTAFAVPFDLIDSTDNKSNKTGVVALATAYLYKPGIAAGVDVSGRVFAEKTEGASASGVYTLALLTTDLAVAGWNWLKVTATGCNTQEIVIEIVANSLDALGAKVDTIDTETDKIQGIDDNVDTINTNAAAIKAGLIIHSGTALGGTASIIILGEDQPPAALTNLAGNLLVITGGTGAGQVRMVYLSVWDEEKEEWTARVNENFATTPDVDSTYIVLSLGRSQVNRFAATNGADSGRPEIYAGGTLTAAQVWAYSEGDTQRTLGAAGNTAIASANWNLATASVTAGIGLQIKTNLDATISSVATAVSGVAAAVWAVGTRTLTGFGTLVADIATAVWGAVSRTITGTVTVGTNNDKTGYALTTAPAVAGDKMDLVDAPNATALTAIGTAVWATTSRVLTAATNITADIATAVWGAAARTLTAGVATAQQVWEYATRALTDKAGFTLHADYDAAKTAASATNVSDTQTAITNAISALNNLSAAQVRTQADNALTAYDPPTKAELDTAQGVITDAIAALDTLIDAIKERTDNLPDEPASVEDVHTYESEPDTQ